MVRLIRPPRDEEPTSWAHRYDRNPTFVPTWPDDADTAVVLLVRHSNEKEPYVEAYFVETREDLGRCVLLDPPDPVLFFNLPRSLVDRCEFTEESLFEEDEAGQGDAPQ